MLLTDRFVFVHLPKTGGTFVTTALKSLLCPSRFRQRVHSLRKRTRIRIPGYPYRYREIRQHAMCKHIPESHRALPILACVRNPYDLYVSHYTFGWWQTHPQQWYADAERIAARYPHFPSLSFEEFVDSLECSQRWVESGAKAHPAARELGWHSLEFMGYFCPDKSTILRETGGGPGLTARFRESMYPVRFLHTDRLNEELYGTLLSFGHAEAELAFIGTKSRVMVSRPKNKQWQEYYTPELKQRVRKRERLLFELFPEFDV